MFHIYEKIVKCRKLQDDPLGINLMPFINELRYSSEIGRKMKQNPSGFYMKKIKCHQATGRYGFCAIFFHQSYQNHDFFTKNV